MGSARETRGKTRAVGWEEGTQADDIEMSMALQQTGCSQEIKRYSVMQESAHCHVSEKSIPAPPMGEGQKQDPGRESWPQPASVPQGR